MGDRHTEYSHHRIADELLDRASMAFDNRAHALEVPSKQRAQRFRIDHLAERSRTSDVAEKHSNRLANTHPSLDD